MSPQELLEKKSRALNAALAETKITASQFSAAMQKSAFIAANSYAGMASEIAGNLATAFGNSKAFAIASAVINTAQSVTKSLAEYGGTPWGWAAAAAAAAAGAAQIATIRSTTKNSGGGGGSAGAPVASAAVTAPAAPQQSVTIALQGERFGREQVRALIAQINDAVSDGAVLRVA
jgi:hypothetical protein